MIYIELFGNKNRLEALAAHTKCINMQLYQILDYTKLGVYTQTDINIG